jgi:tRNA 2-thiocytidine biosynthesis protein TtcA
VKRVIPEGKTMCGLCSRLRRGIIYKLAKDLKATKIALGHHRDDAIETLFLNLFYGGRLKSMPPKLLSDDKKNILIRPLYYCSEEDIARYANYRNFPIIPCNLCGSQEQLKRAEIKKMIAEWKKANTDVEQKIFRSMMNIDLSQLSDSTLFDFDGLENFRD